MAIKPLNSVAGFSVGEAPSTVVIYANGDITTTNLTTTGVANLNAVGNVKISGGTSGQVLSTDGAGNLSFVTIGTASLNNGTSNVTVLNNGNILFGIAGNANVAVITGTGINVAGTLNATGNANVGNLGAAQILATANITAPQLISNIANGTAPIVVSSSTLVSNLNADLLDGYNTSVTASANTVVVRNADGNVAANYFIGNGSQLTGLNTDRIANGTSNVLIPASGGNVNTSVGGNANVFVVTGTGVNVAGTMNATGNANVGNLGTGGLITATGNVSGGNLTTGGVVAATGNVSGGNLTTGGALSVTGNANVGNIGAAAGVFTATVTAGNVYANSGIIGAQTLKGEGGNISNIQGANVSGAVASATSATTAGTVTTAAQPNITSTGVLSNLVVANTIYADGYGARTGSDLTLSTAGNGNLIISVAGTGITNFSGKPVSNISNLSATGTLSITGNANVGNLGTAGLITATGNVSGGNLTTGGAVVATGNVSGGNLTTTGVLSVTGNANVGNLGTAGLITATGNVTGGNLTTGGVLSVTGNANVGNLGTGGIITATGNITSSANLISDNILGRTGALTITSAGTNTNINLKPNGTGNIDANSTYITNVKDPSSAQDAATKQYVDNLASTAIAYHEPVSVATTTTLAIATGGTTAYNSPNGAANGIGAYISTTGTFNLIDGANVQTAGTRILVKNEANAAWNGVYTYTNATAITRSTDTDEYGPNSSEQLSVNDYFFVQGGLVNEGISYIVNAPTGTITFGTSLITFAQFSTSQVYDAGTGLTLSNTTFSISNTAVTAGSYGNGDRVATFTVNGQGQLTAASNTAITANAANLTGTTLASSITTSSLTTVGTLGSLSVTGNASAGNISTGGVLSVTGNANVGNLGTAQVLATANITAPQLISNVATGTAPLVVSSTTQVANLNAATAGTAGTVTTAAQPNITSVGTLTSLSVTGNVSTGNISGTNGNLTTANISGNLILGNSSVTTTVTWASATTTAITANQTIASFSVTGVTGVEFLVKGIDSTGSKYSVATVQAVTDGANVDYSTFGGVNLGGYTGTLAVNIVGGQIRLQVTPSSSNSTVWTTQYRLI